MSTDAMLKRAMKQAQLDDEGKVSGSAAKGEQVRQNEEGEWSRAANAGPSDTPRFKKLNSSENHDKDVGLECRPPGSQSTVMIPTWQSSELGCIEAVRGHALCAQQGDATAQIDGTLTASAAH